MLLGQTRRIGFRCPINAKHYSVHRVWLLIALLLLATVLRFYQLGNAQLWYDESFTVLLARADIRSMITATAGDTHPPLYYLIIWAIAHAGYLSAFAMRSISALLSVGSIYLTWRVGIRLHIPERAIWIAVLFMTVSSFQLHYAQEARMYALLQAEILLAMVAILDRRPLVYIVSAIAMLYTHNYSVFFIPVFWFVDYMWCNDIKRATIRATIPVLLWIPWALVLLNQMVSIEGGYWIKPVTSGSVIYTLYMLFWGFAMPGHWQPVAVMLTSGLLAFTIWTILQNKPNNWVILITWAIVPLTLSIIVSVIWRPILLFRGLIGCAPVLYLLVAQAISQPRARTWLVAAMTIPVITAGMYGFYKYNPTNKGDVLTAIMRVENQWQPGDIVVHANDGSMVSWVAYSHILSLPHDIHQVRMPSCEQEPEGALSTQTRNALHLPSDYPGNIPHKRVWVIWSLGPTSPQCEVDQMLPLIATGKLILLIRNDDLVRSGIWLVSN